MSDKQQKHIEKLINEQNNRGVSNFEGYSPNEMRYILYDTFGQNSPISLAELTNIDYQKIPILNQIRYVADLINQQGEVKLTGKGFLPTKHVKT